MSKYTQAAKGEACTVRIPGLCRNDQSTTVAAHLNGAGMGIKNKDIFIAFACSDCHEWLDGGYTRQGVLKAVRDFWHLQAMMRTQARLIELDILKL